jgi:hypothetical protein
LLLADEEWAKASDRWVAEQCKVSDHLVASVRSTALSRNEGAETRTGKDGRSQPARRSHGSKEAKPHKPPANGESPLLDSEDEPVPPGLMMVFEKANNFRGIVNQLNEINRALQELSQHPAGACFRLQEAQIELRNLKDAVHFGTPYVVCPACKGIAKTRKANCPCKQRGWLIETSYKNLPQEYRK